MSLTVETEHVSDTEGAKTPDFLLNYHESDSTPSKQVINALKANSGLPLSDEQINQELLKTLEYYFSSKNLSTDTYLLSQMDADAYVPVGLIAQFRKIKKLTNNLDHILNLIRQSNQLELDGSSTRVRSIGGVNGGIVTVPAFNHQQRCVLVLRDVASEATLEQIKNLFIDKEPSCPPCYQCESAGNDSWYITFINEEEAQRALHYLKGEVQSFLDKPIRARIKAHTAIPRSVSGGVKLNPSTPPPNLNQIDSNLSPSSSPYTSFTLPHHFKITSPQQQHQNQSQPYLISNSPTPYWHLNTKPSYHITYDPASYPPKSPNDDATANSNSIIKSDIKKDDDLNNVNDPSSISVTVYQPPLPILHTPTTTHLQYNTFYQNNYIPSTNTTTSTNNNGSSLYSTQSNNQTNFILQPQQFLTQSQLSSGYYNKSATPTPSGNSTATTSGSNLVNTPVYQHHNHHTNQQPPPPPPHHPYLIANLNNHHTHHVPNVMNAFNATAVYQYAAYAMHQNNNNNNNNGQHYNSVVQQGNGVNSSNGAQSFYDENNQNNSNLSAESLNLKSNETHNPTILIYNHGLG